MLDKFSEWETTKVAPSLSSPWNLPRLPPLLKFSTLLTQGVIMNILLGDSIIPVAR